MFSTSQTMQYDHNGENNPKIRYWCARVIANFTADLERAKTKLVMQLRHHGVRLRDGQHAIERQTVMVMIGFLPELPASRVVYINPVSFYCSSSSRVFSLPNLRSESPYSIPIQSETSPMNGGNSKGSQGILCAYNCRLDINFWGERCNSAVWSWGHTLVWLSSTEERWTSTIIK